MLKIPNPFRVAVSCNADYGCILPFNYVPKHVKAGEPVLALANYFLTYAPIEGLNQPAYVVPDSMEIWDTPAEIRTRVATLKCGDQVQALGHFRDWTHVRTLDGKEGWVNDAGLMNAGSMKRKGVCAQKSPICPRRPEAMRPMRTISISSLHAKLRLWPK